MLRPSALLSALLVLGAAPGIPQGPPTPGNALHIVCTPSSVRIDGERAVAARNPIAEALERAAPGCVITLRPGGYPGFTIGFSKKSPRNARATGGLPGRPVTIVGEGHVRIKADPDVGDTISINQQIPNGNITFRNLIIEPGYRAAILFFKQDGGRTHDNFSFLDCNILGSWKHARDSGIRSKWGVWGHSMRNFEFRGVTRKALVQDIQQEHGFYIQNPQGPILIENVAAARLGRTFCQFTAREKDGPPGIGSITVRHCEVEDIGLSAWDNHKGGYAFTFAGRLTGDILVEGNSYRAGFEPELARLTPDGVPYGTGALVCWDGGEKVRNRKVVLKDNDFEFAPGCGDRPVVSIGGCGQVAVVGHNRFVSGGRQAALSLDPPVAEPGSRPNSKRNGRVYLSEETEVVGEIQLQGRKIDDARLQKLQTPPARAHRAAGSNGR